ncbi:uncharacterized protein LOC117180040 [Belonocnema kinseyi]|uniref:uncharacterized protein LOC117180040 n=1 Tax=Belonocnema kinseyi TaxID=2817044 RepID=UPI00143D6AE2|nr:uncharacterized protein LOC117180040 [Belonocnema kinseyi]
MEVNVLLLQADFQECARDWILKEDTGYHGSSREVPRTFRSKRRNSLQIQVIFRSYNQNQHLLDHQLQQRQMIEDQVLNKFHQQQFFNSEPLEVDQHIQAGGAQTVNWDVHAQPY